MLGSADPGKDTCNSLRQPPIVMGSGENSCKHGNCKSCDIESTCCDVWGPGSDAVHLPWRFTGRSPSTLTTRNNTGLDKLSKASPGSGEGGWLCVGGDVTGRYGDLWIQGSIIAYGRAAEAFSHELGDGGLRLPVNGKLPQR